MENKKLIEEWLQNIYNNDYFDEERKFEILSEEIDKTIQKAREGTIKIEDAKKMIRSWEINSEDIISLIEYLERELFKLKMNKNGK